MLCTVMARNRTVLLDEKMTLQQAAKACEMPVGTFYSKARKVESVI